MRLEEREFGRLPDGSVVRLITAFGAGGLEASVMSYGATLVSVRFPSRGAPADEITLGFDSLEGYLGRHPYFGATVGRYANRIADAGFAIDGKRYPLAANNGDNHLHGGIVGFNRVQWTTSISAGSDEARIRFARVSRSGEEGYPGNLDVSVTYVVRDDNVIRFEYRATTDAATAVNLTNHTYWNLDRPGVDVRDHLVTLSAKSYLAIDDQFVPTGTVTETAGTPFDFTSGKRIRDDFARAGLYDHNFVVDGKPGRVREAAVVVCERTGRRMTIRTDQPAMQFYTANNMSDLPGRGGVLFPRYGALCLETGGYNNSVNIPSFPSTILRPGESYRHTTEHAFEVT